MTYNEYAIIKDTARLKLNYRDPFGITQPDTVKIVQKKSTPVIKQPPINWGFVQYLGYVRNPQNRRVIALLNIHGKEVQMGEGEINDQVKLIKNLRDSIKISFQGKIKFITVHRM